MILCNLLFFGKAFTGKVWQDILSGMEVETTRKYGSAEVKMVSLKDCFQKIAQEKRPVRLLRAVGEDIALFKSCM